MFCNRNTRNGEGLTIIVDQMYRRPNPKRKTIMSEKRSSDFFWHQHQVIVSEASINFLNLSNQSKNKNCCKTMIIKTLIIYLYIYECSMINNHKLIILFLILIINLILINNSKQCRRWRGPGPDSRYSQFGKITF